MTSTPLNFPARQAALLTAVALWGSAYFYTGGGASQAAHYATVQAILKHQTFALDAFPNVNVDVAKAGGHTFSNKPPGFPLLLLPAGAVGLAAEKVWPGRPGTALQVGAWVTQVLGLGGCGLWIMWLLMRLLSLQTNVATAAFLAALGYVGTYLWPFSTTFFSHLMTAALGMGAAFLMAQGVATTVQAGLVGLLLGLGPLVELSAAVAFLPVGLLAVWNARTSARQLLALCVGAAIPVGILMAYQAAYFGGPLQFSYGHVTTDHQVEGHAQGFLGAGWPRPLEFLELAIGYYRGLFSLAPLCALGAWGLWKAPYQATARTLLAGTLALFLFISGYWAWQGGSSFGPRFLLPVVPWLLMGLATAWQARRKWVLGCGIYGALGMVTGPAVCMIPHASHTPGYYWLTGFLGLKLLRGQVPAYSEPLVNETSLPAASQNALGTAWNLGHVLGLGGAWTVLPFVVVMGGLLWLLWRDAQRSSSETQA